LRGHIQLKGLKGVEGVEEVEEFKVESLMFRRWIKRSCGLTNTYGQFDCSKPGLLHLLPVRRDV